MRGNVGMFGSSPSAQEVAVVSSLRRSGKFDDALSHILAATWDYNDNLRNFYAIHHEACRVTAECDRARPTLT
jgi:hypothetical protein